MSNPFGDIKEKRLAQESKLQQEKEKKELAERIAQEERQKRDQLTKDLFQQHDSMVMRVLNHLHDALGWSSQYVKKIEEHLNWGIGHEVSDQIEFSSSSEFKYAVKVEIDFEQTPCRFICSTNGITKTCSLSETDLIKTLSQFNWKI